MGLEEILARDDVPSDVKQIITNLDERLREAEFTNLWNIFSQSEIPTLILSKEGEITNYNDSMEKLTGYSHQEVPDINAWFPKIYPDEEYRSKVFEISRRSQNREITVRRDVFKITRKDGKQRFIEFSVYDVFHAGKSTNLQVVQGVDVTDQKETEGKLEAYRKHLEELVKTRTKDLRESRDLYRVLFESAPIAIGTSDFDGKALTFNQNTLEMMGYTADELKTINLADTYVDPNDRKELLQTLQKVGSVLDREVRRKRKDGSVYHLLMNSERIELGGQQIFLTTMRDITDRKIAVKALRQSEVRYASILRVAPIGIGVVQNRVISFISDSFLEMVGYSRDELLGQNARIVYPSDEEYDRVGREKYVQIEKFGTGSVDARLRHKSGRIIEVDLRSTLIDPSDPSAGVTFTVLDITERKQAEEAVRRERDRARQYINMSGGIMFALNRQGEITLINKMGCQILGFNEKEIIGKNWFDTFIPERIREDLKIIFKAFIAEKSRSEMEALHEKLLGPEFEFRVNPVKTKSGSKRLIIWANSLVRNDTGEIAGIISSGQDITERKQIEKTLKESERKLQTIMDAIQTGIVIIDAQSHRIVDVNPMAINMIGAPKENIISSECHKFICPAERGRCPIWDLGQKVDQSERILLRAGGEKIPILKTANTVILDEQMLIVESFIDITERKQTEELMRIQRDLGVALSSTSNLMETLDLILNAALKIKEIDSGGVYLVDRDTGGLYLAHYKGFSESFAEYVSHIEADDPRAKLVKKGKPVYGQHKQVVPSVDKRRREERLLTLGVIPVLYEEKVVAALNVASHSVKEISKPAKGTLEAIATQIGSTLELKKTEEAFRESQEKYQMLVEKLEEGVLLEDKEGQVSFVNPKAAEMLGLPMEEIIGQHWNHFVPEIYLEVTSSESRKRSKGISSSYEISLKAEDGSTIPVIVSATPIFSKKGEFFGVVSVFTDITERKQAEEAIRKERDIAQQYLDIAGVMFVAIDKEGRVTLINKKGCDILGYDEQEIIGKNWFDNFLPEHIRENVKIPHKQLLRGEIEIAERYTNPVLRKDGEERIIAWHNTIIKDEKGNVIGHLSSGEDITERKMAEKIRKELEERRENFIYMTTHELRTPLTVIGGYCDFLIGHDEIIDHFRREKIYTTLKNNVNRLERLIRDVSHIAQLERGGFQVEKRETDICSFLNPILEPYNHLLGNQFSFQGCPEEGPIIIQADPDRLQQVMENIISNAIKHTPKDKREIVVTMDSFPNNIQIRVTDNGAGIASEHLEIIFEQFISIPTDYTAMGTGIGLYLAREIIEAHNGTIIAQSPGKNRGSTFLIELPRETD